MIHNNAYKGIIMAYDFFDPKYPPKFILNTFFLNSRKSKNKVSIQIIKTKIIGAHECKQLHLRSSGSNSNDDLSKLII